MEATGTGEGGPEPRYKLWVAVVGVAVSLATFLFATINHELQDHQREQSFESELTTRMTETSVGALTTARAIVGNQLDVASGEPEQRVEQREYLGIRKLWGQASTEVRVKLAAYYGRNSELTREWTDYGSAVTSFIRLGSNEIEERQGLVDDLRSFLGPETVASIPDFDVLLAQPEAERFTTAYFAVHDALTERLLLLAEDVVESHPRGFSNWVPLL
jgi:hypothetical protein